MPFNVSHARVGLPSPPPPPSPKLWSYIDMLAKTMHNNTLIGSAVATTTCWQTPWLGF